MQDVRALVTLMRVLGMLRIRCCYLLAVVSMAPLTAVGEVASVCPSFTFTVEKNGTKAAFDVAELRRDRPELYGILRQRIVQDLYFGQEQAALVRRLSNAYDELSRRGGWPKDEDQQKRLVAFYVQGILGADGLLEKLKFECGSLVDGLAAELSLSFSKPESERLLEIVTDPLHERFLVFMLRSKSAHKIPAEISTNINTNLLKSFNETLVESCKQRGIASITCDKLQLRPPPTRTEHYSALIAKEQQERGIKCTFVESEARKFIRDDLPSILSSMREDRKLTELAEVAPVASKLALQTRVCARLESMARTTGVAFEGHFGKSSHLFALLDPLVRLRSHKTASELTGSTTSVDRIETLAKEVLAE